MQFDKERVMDPMLKINFQHMLITFVTAGWKLNFKLWIKNSCIVVLKIDEERVMDPMLKGNF